MPVTTHVLQILHEDGRIEQVNRRMTLEEMQKAVGGFIQLVPIDARLGIYINEEGKLSPHQQNPTATALMRGIIADDDYIAGNAIVFDMNSEEETDG